MTSGENVAVRTAAINAITGAIERAAIQLEGNGRPGIQAHSGSSGTISTVHGWKVTFARVAGVPLDLQLTRPRCGCYNQGRWYTGVFETGRVSDVILTAARGRDPRSYDSYQIASQSFTGYTDYTRHQWQWRVQSPPEFAGQLLRDTASWLCHCAGREHDFPITQRAQPGAYRAIAEEVARTVCSAFAETAARQLARLDQTRQNQQAREAAIATMVAAIQNAATRLNQSGRPGVGPVDPRLKHHEQITGWRVALNWPPAGSVPLTITAPPKRKNSGNWTMETHRHLHTHFVALTEDAMVAVSERFSFHPWTLKSPAGFAEWILQDWFTWWTWESQPFSYYMADHTEPAEFVPYVEAIATTVATAFNNL